MAGGGPMGAQGDTGELFVVLREEEVGGSGVSR